MYNNQLNNLCMMEEICMLIFVLLISIWVFSDFMEPVSEDQTISELRACHRYAVAEQITDQPSLG